MANCRAFAAFDGILCNPASELGRTLQKRGATEAVWMTKAEQLAILAILKRGDRAWALTEKYSSVTAAKTPRRCARCMRSARPQLWRSEPLHDVDRLLPGQRFDHELDNAQWMELLSDYLQHGKRDYVCDEMR